MKAWGFRRDDIKFLTLFLFPISTNFTWHCSIQVLFFASSSEHTVISIFSLIKLSTKLQLFSNKAPEFLLGQLFVKYTMFIFQSLLKIQVSGLYRQNYEIFLLANNEFKKQIHKSFFDYIQKREIATMIGQDLRFKRIQSTLAQTQKIRNVSIVAHVDHGKTTLADCLIASNGIIHKKQAGQLRLLDDRLDEQNRGITMKSSSICLLAQDHLINLIDSPGHLEFYSEVSAALRLTDCALLVVDVVEGVSSQTFRILHQLYQQKLPSILVLNKMDRLVTHCKMDRLEAYNHLNQIIQQVNAILGSFINKEIANQSGKKGKNQKEDEEKIQRLQDKFFFSPAKKNIIFSSALDNWGFSVENFSSLLSKKLGVEPNQLIKYLWGDYFWNGKKKQFTQKPRKEGERPLCVDFVLGPIWQIFQGVEAEDRDKIQKIIGMLKLKVSENAKKKYGFHLIKQILNSWLPLDKIIFSRIIQVLPNPIETQQFRLPYLLNLNTNDSDIDEEVRMALAKCSNHEEAPLIIFISKMVNIPKGNINERGLNQLEEEGQMRTLGFGRLFSGRCRRGQKAILIGAKKKKIQDQEGNIKQIPDLTQIQIKSLYMFNAQYPEGVSEVYAGNIVGIGGLQNLIFKSGTISSLENCISFTPVASQTKSILKVSVSTPNMEDHQAMHEGLRKINRSDPSVDVYIEPTGDIILNTCGEVHLEKCVVDLEQIYCKVPIKVSEPIINFRQTIVWSQLNENKNQKYIEEINKKNQEAEKRRMKQKYREEMMNDAQLDQLEKEKMKAIEQWDFHVEKYESDDLTAEDTRFFFKNREDSEEEKYNYKQEKIIKKVDHKNRGKLHSKQMFLNLNLKTNVSSQLTPNQMISITVKALGFDFQFAEYLEKTGDLMKKLFASDKKKLPNFSQELQNFIEDLKKKMEQFNIDENVRNLIVKNIVSFGPSNYGSNILVIPKINPKFALFTRILEEQEIDPNEEGFEVNEKMKSILDDYKTSTQQLLNSIIAGFNIACSSGPLCNQPLMGVLFILQNVERIEEEKKEEGKQEKKEQKEEKEDEKSEKKEEETIQEKTEKEEQQKKQIKSEGEKKPIQGQEMKEQKQKLLMDSFGPLTGQIMSTMKDSCVQAFLGASPRLVEPMYLCELQTDQQYYGPIYNELSKRRAKVIDEDLHEVSNIFIIKAHLPINDSYKFCSQILDRTQGTVNAQLNFDTWKIFAEDPFYTPFTEQEIQENGIENVPHNNARILLEKIRKKKGMRTTQKIVAAAEKQKNLKSK